MSKILKVKKYTKKGLALIRDEGFVSFGIKGLQKIQKGQQATTSVPERKRQFVSLVDRDSVMDLSWPKRKYAPVYKKRNSPYEIGWVMSPPAGGGGHQNIFRFMSFLKKKGYKNTVYLYSTFDDTSPGEARTNVEKYCDTAGIDFKYLSDGLKKGTDVLFATGWETAYPVFNEETDALRFYFVQDFEPLFYPMGTDYILAENTYKFGFHGITAGGWLASKLNKDYGMQTDGYNFGADKTIYSVVNNDMRDGVFFYARPVTERRGFDLGIMALELFHRKHPDVTIHLAGWDVSEWHIPFPYVNHKAVSISELNELYNKSSAALVLSLTNMSLLPLELLAAGVVPVVNKGENNSLVSDNKNIRYVDASPVALADALTTAVKANSKSQLSSELSASVVDGGWEDSGARFVSILEKELGRVK